MNGLYGQGFYGNSMATATATAMVYSNVYGMLEIRHNSNCACMSRDFAISL